MNGRVKVYMFRLFDIGNSEFKISTRMATRACIRRIHAELIRSSELEVDKKDLNADGMTEPVFVDGPCCKLFIYVPNATALN
jgi:hypothetical protein